MENSLIKILDVQEQPDSFSVEYEYDGVIDGHTFPKDDYLFEEDEDGIPEWINKLVELELNKEDYAKKKAERIKKNKDINILKSEYQIKSSKKDKIKEMKNKKLKSQLSEAVEGQKG